MSSSCQLSRPAGKVSEIYKPTIFRTTVESRKFEVSKSSRSVTMNIFQKKYFLFKSFLKIEFRYIFTINMVSTAENCKEK